MPNVGSDWKVLSAKNQVRSFVLEGSTIGKLKKKKTMRERREASQGSSGSRS
jgi:hypothetical protein